MSFFQRILLSLRPVTKSLVAHDQGEQKKILLHYQFRVFLGIFIGYAGYYLVRKNIALLLPHLEQHYGYSKLQQGWILGATSLSYGLSKFCMGWISDRSNAKLFLTIGLSGSALISFGYGCFPGLLAYFPLVLFMMSLNGWFQGMGWPSCGRVMVHWFTPKERGKKMALWNISHNIGQAIPALLVSIGMSHVFGWSSPMLIPGIAAGLSAYFAYNLIEDTPRSVGLPDIDQEHQCLDDHKTPHASSLVFKKTLLVQKKDFYHHVLFNPALWCLAFANLFVYLTRYAVIDWLPSYLVEVRGFSSQSAGFSYSLYELAGIAGTLACGWMSDQIFKGRRAPAAILFMVMVTGVLQLYLWLPNEFFWTINLTLFGLGFLIYGPVMLIGLHALDIVPKSVAGTAAGFTGLFGYVGGATCANALFGWIVDCYGWDGGFSLLFFSCFCSIFFLSLTWNSKPLAQSSSVYTRIKKKKLSLYRQSLG